MFVQVFHGGFVWWLMPVHVVMSPAFPPANMFPEITTFEIARGPS